MVDTTTTHVPEDSTSPTNDATSVDTAQQEERIPSPPPLDRLSGEWETILSTEQDAELPVIPEEAEDPTEQDTEEPTDEDHTTQDATSITTADPENSEHQDEENPTDDASTALDPKFGHDLTPEKLENHMRLILSNVGCLPTKSTEAKSLHFIDQLMHYKTDVLMGTEHDWNLKRIKPEHSWLERTRMTLPRQTHLFAHNTHDKHNQSQYKAGGTFMVALQAAQPRIIQKEVDKSGLGRWTWMRIQGRQGQATTVISAYRPCKNKGHVGTVYEQQQSYWDNKGKHDCPIKLFDKDLKQLIKARLKANDHVILGIDANEDVRSGRFHNTMQSLGLKEAVLALHPNSDPPETCNKNQSRVPIDGLFVSAGIQPTQGGYTNYDTTVRSDHRSLWLDIPFTSILGFNPPKPPNPNPRRLRAKDPRCRDKYNKITKKQFSKAEIKLFEEVQTLRDMRDQGAPRINIMLQHSKALSKCMILRKEAARKARHIYDKSYEWSPTWRKLEAEVQLWRVARKRFKRRIKGKYIRRLMKKAGNKDCFSLTEEEMIIRLKNAEEALDEFKPQASKYRKAFLQGLAKELAKRNDTTEEGELKKLNNQESQRKLGRKLKRFSKKGKKGLVRKVEHGPKNAPIWTQDKEGIENLGAGENEVRFTNCLRASQFVTDDVLQEAVGFLCEGHAVDEILAGTYDIPAHLQPYTKMFLEFLQMPDKIKNNTMGKPHLSQEDHNKGWRKARESTASEPTTLDFSHYMCAAYDEALAAMDATLREVPLQYGFAPDEWNPMTDCSIPKKEDSPRLEEMRTIVLMDAAYNMNNKWYGKEFMKHNEALETIPEEQSGSRKRKKAAEVALKKVLAMDLLRQFRRAGFLCSNDAIQCYDRILHNVAMLCMMRLGADKSAVTSLFGQLQQAQHAIMTAHGLSEPKYGGSLRSTQGLPPIQGVMQGNGMGPIIWLAISAVLLGIMHSQGFATLFWGALTVAQISMCGFTFVDDCDLIVAPEDVDTRAQNYLPRFQDAVNCWEGNLRVTGGGIKPIKSFWYLIDFKWDPTSNSWKYMSSEDCPGEVTIRKPDEDGRVTLARCEPWEAKETLGIWMAMDGNQKEEVKKLLEKTKLYTDKLRAAGGMEKNDVWESMTTQIMTTLQYPAAATQLTKDEWTTVLKPIMMGALPKAGFNRYFPRKVLFGPRLYQGMGLIHPYHFQEMEHLEVILNHCTEDTFLGQQLQLSWEALVLELGLPGSLTSWDYKTWEKCTTDCWLKTVWHYCQAEDLHINDPFAKLDLARENDEFLMLAFKDNPKVKDKDLPLLNQCRTYLQVVTLADITSADGRRLIPGVKEGKAPPQRAHNYKWPRQPDKLSKTHWDTWSKALTTCFLNPYSRHDDLNHPLTHWTMKDVSQWTWHYHQATHTLYEREGSEWNTYKPMHRSHRPGSTYSQREATQTLPPQCRPASVTFHQGSEFMVQLQSFSTHRKSTRQTQEDDDQETPHHFSHWLPSSDSNEGWATEDVTQRNSKADNGLNVATAIEEGRGRAVCDGSYKEGEHGTASFTLHGDDPRKQILGLNRTPGRPQEQSPCRSELGGIVGTLSTALAVCKAHGVTKGSLELGVDCEAAIKAITAEHPPKAKAEHFDMIWECRHLLKLLPIEVTFRWIESHQDKKKTMNKMDWWGRQNVFMDARAKKYRRKQAKSPRPPHKLQHERIAIYWRGSKLAKFNKQEVHKMVMEKDAREYWEEKDNMTRSKFNKTNWVAQEKALKEQPRGMRRWWCKHCTRWCGVGRQMKRRQEWDHDRCPLCGKEEETTVHMIKCPTEGATETFNGGMERLDTHMTEQKTCPDLQQAIMDNLRHWREGTPCPRRANLPYPLRWALDDQDHIGWYNFQLGRVAQRITDYQDAHYSKQDSKKTGLRWTVAIIHKLMATAWDMWEHRNAVLHGTSDDYHTKRETAKADRAITKEFLKGKQNLLRKHKHLFQSKRRVLCMTLTDKRRWLDSVEGARRAWKHYKDSMPSYEGERRGMRNWLVQVNPNMQSTNT